VTGWWGRAGKGAPANTKDFKMKTLLMSFGAAVLLGAAAGPACADTLSRSVEVTAPPATVWAMIGPFCAIQDWHPAIGTCVLDGKTPPTRTLVTKDGQATFVELQTARSAAGYSYTFVSSPVPVSRYVSTIKVEARRGGGSTVTWSSAYTPDAGKADDARAALTGIYESGLAAIQARLAP
jgi:hypothetical protein